MIWLALLACGGEVVPSTPPAPPLPPASENPCPPGMVHVAAGTYQTGMRPPMPYGVVDTTQMETVDAPESKCEAAQKAAGDASACWVQTDLADPIVTTRDVTVEGYCMSIRPFPGAGPYPRDGLTTWDAERFDELLSSGLFGPRRMCTYTEYELAVAGPTQNTRFVYGNTADPSRCATGTEELIGGRPSCQNPETGVVDYGAVISQWVHLDDSLVSWACAEGRPCRASGGARLDAREADGNLSLRYIVAGGTHRVQTRQAPYTPHTFHDHGQPSGPAGCDTWGWDDGAAVCASEDARYQACAASPTRPECLELQEQEAAWADLLAHCQGRRITECLNHGLTRLRGSPVDVCPGSEGLMGPGQGR